MSCLDLHSRAFLINVDHSVHVGEIEFRVNAQHQHVDGERNDINVSGPLPVAEQSTLHPVSSCHQAELGRCDRGSSVIMCVQ